MVKLCPKCGAASDKKKFVGAFCVDCYPIEIHSPSTITVYRCKDCGNMRLKKEWMQFSIPKIEEYIQKETKGKFEQAVLEFEERKIKYVIKAGSQLFEVERPVRIDFKEELCTQCNWKHGSYYEAIIQLRGEDGKEDKILRLADKLAKLLTKKTFISKEEHKKNGLDMYIGNKKVVVAVLAELGLKPSRSSSLCGLKEGRRVYRETFLIRV